MAHAGVCCVCGDRKSGARPKQSFGVKPRTGWGIYLGLEVDDGAAAGVEAADGDHDLVAHLRRGAVGGGHKGHAAGKLKYCLRAVEALRRTILDAQGINLTRRQTRGRAAKQGEELSVCAGRSGIILSLR